MKNLILSGRQALKNLTVKAITRRMGADDFARFCQLFENIKYKEYFKYLEILLPALSDAALHDLVAGVIIYKAQNSTANTFLRESSIANGLLVAEAKRHGFNVELNEDGTLKTVPVTVPHVIMAHFAAVLAARPAIFGHNGKPNRDNIVTAIQFGLYKAAVAEAASNLELGIEAEIALQNGQQNELISQLQTIQTTVQLIQGRRMLPEALSDYVDGKVTQIADDIHIQVDDLNLQDAQLQSAQVNGIAHSAAVGLYSTVISIAAKAFAREIVEVSEQQLMPASISSGRLWSAQGLNKRGASAIIKAIHDDIKAALGGYITILQIKESLESILAKVLSRHPSLLQRRLSNEAGKAILISDIIKQLLVTAPQVVGVEDSIFISLSRRFPAQAEGAGSEEDKKEDGDESEQVEQHVMRKRDVVLKPVKAIWKLAKAPLDITRFLSRAPEQEEDGGVQQPEGEEPFTVILNDNYEGIVAAAVAQEDVDASEGDKGDQGDDGKESPDAAASDAADDAAEQVNDAEADLVSSDSSSFTPGGGGEGPLASSHTKESIIMYLSSSTQARYAYSLALRSDNNNGEASDVTSILRYIKSGWEDLTELLKQEKMDSHIVQGAQKLLSPKYVVSFPITSQSMEECFEAECLNLYGKKQSNCGTDENAQVASNDDYNLISLAGDSGPMLSTGIILDKAMHGGDLFPTAQILSCISS